MTGQKTAMSGRNTEHQILPIQGMYCAACATRLEKVLAKVEGVEHVSVNLASEKLR